MGAVMTATERFFATCPRGLEALLAEELSQLGAAELRLLGGGVAFSGDLPLVWRCNLWSRLATRILVQVADGSYAREDDIYRLARTVVWSDWFAVSKTIRVKVTAIKSPLKSMEFVTLRIKDAVCDRFREECDERPSIDTREPDVRIHGFLTENRCTLYLDTSGDPLYQRGLRQKTVSAPLKENLAAGMVKLSGWQPGSSFFDPMCGSGTLLLEAVQVALNVAPGARRTFAFERFENFVPAGWRQMKDEALAGELAAEDLQKKPGNATWGIYGADLDPVAHRATLANLDRAGWLAAVHLSIGDIREATAPSASGVMLSNPPYGVRLSEEDELADFYPALGRALKQSFAGWNCYFLSADTRLPKLVGLKPSKKTPLFNGDLDCRLYEIKMVAGSNRKIKPGQDSTPES